jgi:hypothetical protein
MSPLTGQWGREDGKKGESDRYTPIYGRIRGNQRKYSFSINFPETQSRMDSKTVLKALSRVRVTLMEVGGKKMMVLLNMGEIIQLKQAIINKTPWKIVHTFKDTITSINYNPGTVAWFNIQRGNEKMGFQFEEDSGKGSAEQSELAIALDEAYRALIRKRIDVRLASPA